MVGQGGATGCDMETERSKGHKLAGDAEELKTSVEDSDIF